MRSASGGGPCVNPKLRKVSTSFEACFLPLTMSSSACRSSCTFSFEVSITLSASARMPPQRRALFRQAFGDRAIRRERMRTARSR